MQSKTTARYKTTLENILQRAARQRSAGGSRGSGINNCPDNRQADRAKRKLSVGVVSLLLLAALFSLLGLPDRAAAETVNIDISGGSLYLKGNDDGSSLQYSRNNSDWTSYTGTITVTGATTAHTITVASGSHELILNGVQIDVSQKASEAAFKIADNNTGNVTVILADGSNNSLKSGDNCAGLQKNGDASNSGSLTIKGDILGTGQLTATGRNGGAGIGGSKGTDVAQGDGGPGGACSNITISGGTVMAYSEDNGAGIGGGQGGSGGENDVHGTGGACSNITISGGTITANAYIQGAGIGGGPGGGWSGGQGGACSNITISGGSVTATSAGHSAAIGGSERAAGSYITISGGSVMATGGNFSAGIGGGDNGAGSNITISGGSVTATGRNGGAGIGGGREGDGSDITISGGQVTASGGQNGAGIGGGDDGDGSNITISGGQVTASGGQNGAGIGGGRNGACSNITISGGSVTATGTEGGVCINSSSLYISPAQDMQIKVQAGSNANTAGPVDGSPFTAASGDMAAKVNSLVYFQSTENCVISNKDQLTAFAAYVNAGHYYVDAELAAAITLNSGVLQDDLERADDPSGFGEWTPIGSNAKPYMGTFDGKGHTISGLYVSKRQDYAGMFSCLGSGAAIKNLRLVDSAVNAASPKGATTGALVGRSEGTIENCFVNANVGGWGYLGGLAGRSYGAVSNCGANVLVWAGESGAGGLVGLLDGTLENCWVTGDVGAYNGNTGALFFQHVGGTVSNSYYVVSTVMPECSEGTAKSAAAFASGEVTWLLNGGVTDGTQVWYQDLDNGVTPYDALPQFAGFGAAVYKVRNGYSNSALAVQLTTRLDGTAADLSIILNDPSAELYLAAVNDAAPWTNGIELAKKDNSTGIYQAGDNVAGGSYHIYVCVTDQDGNKVIKDVAAATLNTNSTSLTLDYYAVNLPASQTGYTLAAKDGSTSPVIQGGGYTFTFKLAEGYTDSSTAVVKINGSPVTLNEDGEYTISGITAAQDVTVEGVTANTNTAYKVEHYVMGTDGTYPNTASSSESKTGTTDAELTLVDLKDTTLEVTDGIAYAYGKVDGSDVKVTTAVIKPDGSLLIKLYYERKQHTLTVSKGTGIDSVSGGGNYYYGQSVTVDAAVSQGYTWAGWTSSNVALLPDRNSQNYTFKMPAGAVTLTAGAEFHLYTITYNLDGGTLADNVSNPLGYDVVSEDITLHNPTRTGYTFAGWTGSNGTTAQTSVTISAGITGNLYFTATWTANTYNVTLDAKEATVQGSKSVTATYDNALPAIILPQRVYTVSYNYNSADGGNTEVSANASYIFGGYFDADDGSGTQYYNADGTSAHVWDKAQGAAIYAKWTSAAVTLPTPTRTGYTFGGWYADSSLQNHVGGGGDSYTPAANVDLYSRWTANTYTVTLETNGGTIAAGKEVTGYTYGNETLLPSADDITRDGCTFVGWYADADFSGEAVAKVSTTDSGDKTYHAQWQANIPKVTFTATGADSGILSGVSAGMKYKIVNSVAAVYNQAACNKAANSGDADDSGNDGALTLVTADILVGDSSDADGWIDITSNEDIVLTGLTHGCIIYVKESGNGTTTMDSEVQEIAVTQAEKPAPENGLVITQPTAGGSEGSITMPEGVEYEYSSDNGKTWISASGTVELAPGTYLIRIKAKDGSLASESIEITINKAEYPCQGQELCDLQAGTFNLYLNGIDMGEFTFAPSGSGWTIFSVAEGKYLTQLKGVLQLVDEADAAVWNYSRGCFYQTEKKTSGWWFWSHTKTTNYYLAAAADGSLTAAKSAKSAAAELYKNVSSADHNWSDWYTIGSGQHERICLNCSCTEQGTCQFDPDTHKCQQCDAYDPAYKSMDVDVKVTSRSSCWLFWKTTYYTAQITPAAVGVMTEKVEYSLDNSTWQSGTKYTSRSPVTKLYIRVTDSEGTVWNFIYADGAVSRK